MKPTVNWDSFWIWIKLCELAKKLTQLYTESAHTQYFMFFGGTSVSVAWVAAYLDPVRLVDRL